MCITLLQITICIWWLCCLETWIWTVTYLTQCRLFVWYCCWLSSSNIICSNMLERLIADDIRQMTVVDFCFWQQHQQQQQQQNAAVSSALAQMTTQWTGRLPLISDSLRVWRMQRNCCWRRTDEWSCQHLNFSTLHDCVTLSLNLIIMCYERVSWTDKLTIELMLKVTWLLMTTLHTEVCILLRQKWTDCPVNALRWDTRIS